MAGNRSVGTVNGTPSFKRVLLRYIDIVGNIRGISFDVPPDATDAEVEALVVASQAQTYASIFEVDVSEVYFSVANKGNADQTPDANLASVSDNIVFMFQDDDRTVTRFYQPAPIDSCFVPATDTPDYLSVIGIANAVDALIGGSATLVSMRYTERRSINERVRV